jgi:hypothetical protein
MRWIVVAPLIVGNFVAGCVSNETQQRAAYEARQPEQRQAGAIIAEALAAGDDAQCRSHGMRRGDPAYAQCRATLNDQRSQAAANDRAAFSGAVRGIANGLSANCGNLPPAQAFSCGFSAGYNH